MAAPPSPLALRIEDLGDVPEWGRMLIERLNSFSQDAHQALARGVTRSENLQATEKLALVFTTETTAADTFPIKVAHGLSQNPKHIVCTHLEIASSGSPPGAAWSMTARPTSEGQVLVWFQGLANSTKYRVSMTFE